ncbi:MAG: hypothetical protein AB7O92_20965 [Acidimicrobiia bacterium]
MAIHPQDRRNVSPINAERRRRQIVAELAQLRAGSPDPAHDDDEDRTRAARIAVLRNRLRILNGELRVLPSSPGWSRPPTDRPAPPFDGLDCA